VKGSYFITKPLKEDGGNQASKTATLTSLLQTWSIQLTKQQTVFKWINYHKTDWKQTKFSFLFLVCLLLLLSIPNIQAALPQRPLPRCHLQYCKLLSKLKATSSQLAKCSLEIYFRVFQIKTWLTSVMKKKLFETKLGHFSSKMYRTMSFVFRFLGKIQRTDRHAIRFVSWVDFISNRCPNLPKRRCTTIQTFLWKGRENLYFALMLQITSEFVLKKKKWSLGALYI